MTPTQHDDCHFGEFTHHPEAFHWEKARIMPAYEHKSASSAPQNSSMHPDSPGENCSVIAAIVTGRRTPGHHPSEKRPQKARIISA
jgi:hypothetical protein